MSDEEVIRVIANRIGYVPMDNFTLAGGLWDPVKRCTHLIPNSPLHKKRKEMGLTSSKPFLIGDWLTSRDALTPILAGLSRQEWIDLGTNLQAGYSSLIDSEGDLKFLITISPKDLAHAIAEAIVEQKHEKGAGV